MSSLRTDVPPQTGVPGAQPINSATRASGKKRPTRAPKPVDHTGSARVSLLLFLALSLALSSLNSLLGGVTWLITTVGIAALVLGAAAGTRVLLRNRWAPTVIGVLVTVGALSLLYAPTTAIAGVIPTGETWAAFRSLSGEATASIAEQGIPADPVQGILFLLSWATAIIAVLLDLIANWWRAPALVGVPLLFVLSVPSLIDGTLADPWLFALTAIVYGLTTPEKWNARFNAAAPADAAPGRTGWVTIGAVVISLLIGSTVLMASIAFSFQRYFEHQVEEGRRISQ